VFLAYNLIFAEASNAVHSLFTNEVLTSDSTADMLEKLEELRLSMPETCRCALTKTPPVSSGNQAVGAGAPSNATLPSSDPVTLSGKDQKIGSGNVVYKVFMFKI